MFMRLTDFATVDNSREGRQASTEGWCAGRDKYRDFQRLTLDVVIIYPPTSDREVGSDGNWRATELDDGLETSPSLAFVDELYGINNRNVYWINMESMGRRSSTNQTIYTWLGRCHTCLRLLFLLHPESNKCGEANTSTRNIPKTWVGIYEGISMVYPTPAFYTYFQMNF